MPELPEVETVRRGLLPVMEGRRIELAEVRRPDLRWPLPERMADRLTGARVNRLRRRSKYILADLSTGETLLVHLGMSGRILVAPPAGPAAMPGGFGLNQPAADRHDHVVLTMEDGSCVTFNDPRRFGMMDLVSTAAVETHALLAPLGPEPFANAFHEDYLVARLRGRRSAVKAALLDQRVVAGLGNIYVCEVLHRTGIDPRRQTGRIAAGRIAGLVPA
ncbi:MAG: bifunctional DNA-formamidopyrimidine glycosylase/DNA-(apurinic or apyrimidinic site) lyase, partial [Gemmobacter sp.]